MPQERCSTAYARFAARPITLDCLGVVLWDTAADGVRQPEVGAS